MQFNPIRDDLIKSSNYVEKMENKCVLFHSVVTIKEDNKTIQLILNSITAALLLNRLSEEYCLTVIPIIPEKIKS